MVEESAESKRTFMNWSTEEMCRLCGKPRKEHLPLGSVEYGLGYLCPVQPSENPMRQHFKPVIPQPNANTLNSNLSLND